MQLRQPMPEMFWRGTIKINRPYRDTRSIGRSIGRFSIYLAWLKNFDLSAEALRCPRSRAKPAMHKHFAPMRGRMQGIRQGIFARSTNFHRKGKEASSPQIKRIKAIERTLVFDFENSWMAKDDSVINISGDGTPIGPVVVVQSNRGLPCHGQRVLRIEGQHLIENLIGAGDFDWIGRFRCIGMECNARRDLRSRRRGPIRDKGIQPVPSAEA